jgi:hypothetical protein
MPRKKSEFPLEKITIKLFEGDYKRLQDLHSSRIGGAAVIRQLVRTYLANIEARVDRRVAEKLDIEMTNE